MSSKKSGHTGGIGLKIEPTLRDSRRKKAGGSEGSNLKWGGEKQHNVEKGLGGRVNAGEAD